MDNTPLTNEQKLDEIYQIVKDGESHRRRVFWWNLLRRMIIYGLIVIGYLYYPIIIAKVIEVMKPMILEQAKTLMKENKAGMMEQARKIIGS